MTRAALVAIALLLLAPAARPHVNSPHEHREAIVGGRKVVAVVHLPRAVPGEAEAGLRVLDLAPGEDVEVSFREIPPQGDAQAPDWAPARRSETDPAFFTAPMPLMVFGLFEAEFRIRSSTGEGTIRVPVTARNPEPLSMPAPLATILVLLTAFLTSSAFAIGRSAGADGFREEPQPRTPADARRGLVVGGLAAAAFLGFVAFSCVTWALMHRAFEARTAPPVVADWIIRSGTPRAGKTLDALVSLVGPDGQPATGLLEDGGELVHVTAVAMPGATHVVHVHGRRLPEGPFEVSWTPRDAGRHAIFVDYGTREAGHLTIVQEIVTGPGMPGSGLPMMAAPAPEGTSLPPIGDPRTAGRDQPLGIGWTVTWTLPETSLLTAGEFVTMQFQPRRDAIDAATLDFARSELVILRDDASVYDRLLPALLESAEGGAGDAGAQPPVRFAYGFPQPGRYRVILTVPDAGGGRAAAFDLQVR